jgi:hypothetical protein
MKILFYVNYAGPPESADYQHCVIALAEGLRANHIPFDANVDYYRVGDSYLFQKKENINPNDYDYIITSYSCGIIEGRKPYPDKTSFIPPDILQNKSPTRKYKTIMLDWSDGYYTYIKNAKYYDYYFVCNYSHVLKSHYPNVFPLCFSATNRIVEAVTTHAVPFDKRKTQMLYSHRILHPIRKYAVDYIYSMFTDFYSTFNDNFSGLPTDHPEYIHWAQSGRRHNPNFYKELGNTKIADCLGGYAQNTNDGKTIVYQIDSFKLWESFFSGCCVIMVHLESVGIQFPHQPVNMEHYIGFTLDKIHDTQIMFDIVNGSIDVEKIARQGQEWANTYYSPSALSSYVLQTVQDK